MSMQLVTKLCAVGGLLLLWGCGSNPSLSEYQCSAGDWYAVGESDGRRGHSQSRMLVHQDACGPQGIVPDSKEYRAGWSQGVAQFCEPQRAFQQGVAGKGLSKVCPQELRDEFVLAYEDGRRLYVARREVSQLENAVAHAEQRVDSINSEVIELSAAQLEVGLTPQDRVALVTNTQELLSEKERLHRDLPQMRRDLEAALDDLAIVESTTPRLVSARAN